MFIRAGSYPNKTKRECATDKNNLNKISDPKRILKNSVLEQDHLKISLINKKCARMTFKSPSLTISVPFSARGLNIFVHFSSLIMMFRL